MGFGSRTPTGASSPERRLERTYRPPSARISRPVLPPLRGPRQIRHGLRERRVEASIDIGAWGSAEASEDARVGVERRLPAEGGVEDARAFDDASAPHEIDERGHRFSFVDGIGEHSFEAGAEADRLDRLLVGDAVAASVPLVPKNDLPAPALPPRRPPPPPPAPPPPATLRGRSESAKPAIIPAWVDPVTEQTMMVSKNTPSARSCSWTSIAHRAKP